MPNRRSSKSKSCETCGKHISGKKKKYCSDKCNPRVYSRRVVFSSDEFLIKKEEMLRESCEAKGTSFQTKHKAERYIRENALRVTHHCWECTWCKGWHVTEKPTKEVNK